MIPTRQDMVVTRWGARFMGRRFPCAVGRGGIGPDKTEGDGVTPAGVLRVIGSGFRPDRMARITVGFRLRPIGFHDIWSDDPADPAYNHGFYALGHAFSHEKLRRADPLYDLVLMSDWNWPEAKPGKGSAIFIHQWRKPRHPTEGCIAFSRPNLNWIAARWAPQSRILVRG